MRARSRVLVAAGGAIAIVVALYGCVVSPNDHAPPAGACTDDPRCGLGMGAGRGGGSSPNGGAPGSSGGPEGPSGPEAGTEAGVTPGFDASTTGETTPTSPGGPDGTTPVSPGM